MPASTFTSTVCQRLSYLLISVPVVRSCAIRCAAFLLRTASFNIRLPDIASGASAGVNPERKAEKAAGKSGSGRAAVDGADEASAGRQAPCREIGKRSAAQVAREQFERALRPRPCRRRRRRACASRAGAARLRIRAASPRLRRSASRMMRPCDGSASRVTKPRAAITLITSFADCGVIHERSASCAFDDAPRASSTDSAVYCASVMPSGASASVIMATQQPVETADHVGQALLHARLRLVAGRAGGGLRGGLRIRGFGWCGTHGAGGMELRAILPARREANGGRHAGQPLRTHARVADRRPSRETRCVSGIP